MIQTVYSQTCDAVGVHFKLVVVGAEEASALTTLHVELLDVTILVAKDSEVAALRDSNRSNSLVFH